MKGSDNDNVGAQINDLTWREQDVLNLLAERMTNREIAGQLHLAESTVKDYVGRILSKLYVNNRREAVRRARELGLLAGQPKQALPAPGNLPAESRPFVGRVSEMAQVNQLLAETRLLTLTGPGGMGKTRLAIKAAAEIDGAFNDGRFLVSLAPIPSSDQIAQAMSEAMKCPLTKHEDPQRQMLRYLRGRQLLLVLDNFEHLLEGAGFVGEMLEAAPGLKVLATSRERLRLHGETTFVLGGMELPPVEMGDDPRQADSVALFIQSARKVRPGYEPTAGEVAQIAAICRLLSGMPLAIELAAAWLHMLSVENIAQGLEGGLDILSAGPRDAPDRHQSIRAVFDHSWRLLKAEEREIFKRLSVFRGGFTPEAARMVAGASLQSLGELVNKSLLAADQAGGRLKIHELLRQYAQEALEQSAGTSDLARQAHADYFAGFMWERWLKLKGRGQMAALAEVEADIENVRAAWRYCLDRRDVPRLWQFIRGLWQVYWIRGWFNAGMRLFARAARALDGVEGDEAETLSTLAAVFQSYFMAWLDRAEQGYALASESAAKLKRNHQQEALLFAYDSLLVNTYILNRFSELIEPAAQMMVITAEMDDPWLKALSLFAASWASMSQEDYPEARRLAEAILHINEETGDKIGSAIPHLMLGHAALAEGAYERARTHYGHCLSISEETGFHYGLQNATKYLGKVLLSMGRAGEAEQYLRLSLKRTHEIGFVRDMVLLLYEFGRLNVARGRPKTAAELLAFVIRHPSSRQASMLEGSIRDNARELIAELEKAMPEEDYPTAVAVGKQLELETVIDNILEPPE